MKPIFIVSIACFVLFSFTDCHKKEPQQTLLEFTAEFFQQYIPELPQTRLLTKADLPEQQQQFFEEAEAQLQLLADLNENGLPEYIISGVSEQFLQNKIKKPYFVAIFERQETEIKRLFFQQVFIPPVNLSLVKDDAQSRVVISFAFSSEFGAEIYYDEEGYHLEQWE